MKVLHLFASPFFSGPAETIAQLALTQRSLGHEVSVAVDRKRTITSAEELAAPRFSALGLLDEGLELSVKSSPLAVTRDLATLRRRRDVEVIHCHFSHDHFLARLACPSTVRVIRSIHAPRSLRRLRPRADGWTVPVESLARRLLGERVMVLPALVGTEFRPPADRAWVRRQLSLPDVPLIGMVSTFQPSRRHALALDAFDQLSRRRPDAHLILVGDGHLGPALDAAARAKGLAARVHFVGYQREQAFVHWLQALDELWVLGLGNDFAARAAAQARACGVRVIAVDEGALSTWADLVVAPEADAVAAAALTPSRREVPLHTIDAVTRRVLELYGPRE